MPTPYCHPDRSEERAKWRDLGVCDDRLRPPFAAVGFSGAYIGGGYPLMWAMIRNLSAWAESGNTAFTFAGNLPPGVDEDDLLILLVIGMAILIGQATAETWRAVQSPA